MTPEESIRNALTEIGALAVTDGKHYILERQALCTHPRQLGFLAGNLAGRFHRRKIGSVVGAFMTPSCIIATAVGQELDRLAGPVKTAFVSEEPTEMPCFFLQEFYRPVVEGENVLIIDDFITDSDWTLAIINEVRRRGGRVIGLGVIAETAGNFDEVFSMVPYRHTLLRSHQLIG